MAKIEDKIKTNIRVSKNMKERFRELAGDKDLQDKLEELIINYNATWEQVGFEKMVIASLQSQTHRKIQYNDENKDEMAKDQILTLKTDRDVYETFKKHCAELGVVFGEGIRRMLNQAIVQQSRHEYNMQMSIDEVK